MPIINDFYKKLLVIYFSMPLLSLSSTYGDKTDSLDSLFIRPDQASLDGAQWPLRADQCKILPVDQHWFVHMQELVMESVTYGFAPKSRAVSGLTFYS